ncbi:SdpI/YhfL protein family [Bifidobacterium mongoliense]|uniref:SdpI/YhfL protein family n=3 Tax=Bifidobacterium mongoliense TaxID=518643 RepID=A0A423UD51_9BIFI|nr:SdpI/YhfL protein family [Bifidobacterium mongoliense]
MDWIWFVVMSLIIPVMMIASAPLCSWAAKDDGLRYGLIGYRTPLSRSSPENWREGSEYSARVLLITGVILLLISIGLSVAAVWLSADTRSRLSLVTVAVQVVLLVLSIIPVEVHLHRFDRE